jgi:hypothetical protein
MKARGQSIENFDLATQLLSDFPHKGSCGLFTGFHFSTWELPFQSQMLALGPLSDENAFTPKNQGTDNDHRLLHDSLSVCRNWVGVSEVIFLKSLLKKN